MSSGYPPYPGQQPGTPAPPPRVPWDEPTGPTTPYGPEHAVPARPSGSRVGQESESGPDAPAGPPPGPMPPRIEPHRAEQSWPEQRSPAPATATAWAGPYPPPPPPPAPVTGPGNPAGPPPAGPFRAAPASYPATLPPPSAPPAFGAPAGAGQPPAAGGPTGGEYPPARFGAAAPGGPGFPPATAGPTGTTRLGWPTVTALVLVGVLLLVAGLEAFQINRLSDRLSRTDQRLAEAQNGDGTRLNGLEDRATALEKQAGTVFNPEAVAAAVLPSVFRVRAGQFTGTAFAIGKPADGGGTNLFTNFHVVESVWKAGGRKVDLERTSQRFSATIVKVDEENDVAQLRTDGKFAGLTAAPAAVKSGQQIVVVGAPLGLEDTVTTGVVSAFRKSEKGSGPAVQFDAPINPGNSGGPVINGSKQVVGIATAKARNAEGIGLAVPINVACDGFKIC
jgi:putative serine protease PepD